MKKIAFLSLVAIMGMSCNAQDHGKKEDLKKDDMAEMAKKPEGTWKVDKEFDENGNMIRYDSIYSWSSGDNFEDLDPISRDSLLQSFRSRFYHNFKGFDNERFGDLFSQDSLFANRFFDEDFFTTPFGEDFMDIDRIRERMEDRQKEFLEKYQSEFYKQGAEEPEEKQQ